jgi:hypothetical protein
MTNQIYLSVALSAAYCTKWSQNAPCPDDRRRAKSSARLSLKYIFVRLGPTQESLSTQQQVVEKEVTMHAFSCANCQGNYI